MSLRPLRPHQVAALDGLKASLMAGHRRPMLSSPTGSGKCLGLGTPVMRHDGVVVPVEDVSRGDDLMGPDGFPRRVLSTCRGSGALFRIVPTKGDPWVCNDVHVLTLVRTQTGRVIDIALDGYISTSKTFKHEHKLFAPPDGIDFDAGEDPDIDPYWLGLWLGDGSKSLKGVAISKPDAEVLESCLEVASVHGLSVRTDGASCPSHHLHGERGAGNPLLAKLRSLFGRPAMTFPHSVRVASRLYRQEFLAGVIDSDGHVHNGCVEIIQKNWAFADGIAFIARSLGLKVYMRSKIVNGETYWRMGVSGDFTGIVTRIPRKRLDPRRQIKCATRTGFRVEPIGVGEYAGFELDGDGRFLLGDFTVTHNTVLAAHIVSGAMAKHKRVAFCVPALSLVDQSFDRFQENGISPLDMGIQQADHPWRREFAPVQIATAQTLSRRELPQADVVVIDEAHIRFAVYERWMREHPETVFIGLSATPWSAGLGRLFDDLVKPVTIAELIDAGLLSRFRVFAPSKPDLDGVKTVAGDYHEGQLAERMNQPTLVADIVETWLARGENRPTLCFATGRKHARAIHDEFRSVGVPVAYVDANTPRAEREAIGRALAVGEIKIVCNIGTLTTGIDWDVRCIILARPTQSESLFVQIVGRGLRTADGKPDCVLLDHSDTHQRLGFVTDIDSDGLDMGRAAKASSKAREKKPRLPVCCAHCTALMPVLAKACDVCGHALPEPKFEVGEGELVEMRGGKSKPAPDSPKALLIALGKQAVWGQIKALQVERGRSDGWAAHTYRSIFDVWPRGLGSLPQEPGTQLRAWVRHRDIAFSKSRKAHQEASHAAL